ncbi:AAA family ATPase [Muricauda ruestringensis]|uniref:AAA family ATPase n=1 Tax=Flagellimonas ruestringensis TaxID=111501 RepID=UPI001CD76A18|nr:AAA family ATPase [Allomuricauda ruestringensis]MCA0957733.1 AAA family ATPase [Allomuricauda ruestringensis]
MAAIEHYSFLTLGDFVTHLRGQEKKVHLLFAYNGTGKTRLSMKFKDAGKKAHQSPLSFQDGENIVFQDGTQMAVDTVISDTLYFNAFTEDLFYWDNDLENDTERVLKINQDSKFFEGLPELEMENRIRPLLRRYSDFDFFIDYTKWHIMFTREERVDEETITHEFIKVSRGEERLFIWCFFLAIVQLAIDKQEAYDWVNYIYVDDPISSLDDHNAISVAHHLAQMLKTEENEIKAVISTHHALFFNVLCNEFRSAKKFFIKKGKDGYTLKTTTDSPFIYHITLIQELKRAVENDRLFTYHFNVLRTILEKAANFHGFSRFSDCMEIDGDDEERTLHSRLVNIMSHGAYSLFEPVEMVEENKEYFKNIFNNYLSNYKFNELLFTDENPEPIA